MDDSSQIASGPPPLRMVFRLFMGLWVAFLGMLFYLNWEQAEWSTVQLALAEARSSFNKDLVYRRWATTHGGVYVPPTQETLSNPYLSHLPDRDVETTTGKKLTLINPAYMTRQVHEMGREQYGARGHITSLKPIRPENAPDAWEVKALTAFEKGATEIDSVEIMEGMSFLRFMRPMITEAGCLKCHGLQGYKEGDIRGGISVSVPLAPYLAAAGQQESLLAAEYGLIGLLGLLGIWFGGRSVARAQAALQESEERFRKLFEESPIGIAFLGKQRESILTNQRYRDFLGYSEAEISELGPKGLIHSDDWEPSMALSLKLRSGEIPMCHMEQRYIRKDGAVVWADTHTTALRDTEGALVHTIGWVQDITERKRTAEALRLRESYLTALIENQPGLLWLKDSGSRFLAVNNAFVRSCGRQGTEEVIGKTDLDVWPEDLAEKYRTDDKDIMVKRTPIAIEEQICDRGVVKWFQTFKAPVFTADGEVLGTCGFSLDITERKRAEEALAHSHDLMSYIIEHNRSAVAVHDRDLRYVYVSQRYLEEYKVKDPDVIGKHHYEVFPNLPQRWRDVHQRALAGEICRAEDDPYEREDGTIEWTRWECRPWYQSDGSIGGIIVYTELITDRKRAEEERERLQAQLLQAQKMESVGRLAGGVAHDFNNMLGVILGHTELALGEIGSTQPAYHDLQEVLKAAYRSADLVRQLLAFARKQTISPKVLSINETVESMLKMVQRLIGEDIELVWKPGTNIWPVKVDPTQIDQILANLCVNARDAIAGVGKIMIETGNVTLDDAYCRGHAGTPPGDYVVLSLRDDGCGMDKETQGKIFEPFFTTKEVGKGTGLGLATVYGIVKQNNGFISVQSERGRGTTFRIYLPPAGMPTGEERRVGLKKRNLQGTETVLLVEDDESILAMGKTILERYGYTVLATQSPDGALRLAKSRSGPLHLLITDVVMPLMNGKDLREKLEAAMPGLKCIFMSGYTADIIADHGALDEGIDFLQKPFSVETLVAKVREVLDG